MKKLILSVMLLGGLFTACNKESDTPTTREEIARKWTIYEYVRDSVSFTYRELEGATTEFTKDGTYYLDMPKQKVQGITGKWELSSDNSKFYFDKGTDSAVTCNVVQINSYMLKLKGINTNLDITYVPNKAE